jgi:hypothetical protein
MMIISTTTAATAAMIPSIKAATIRIAPILTIKGLLRFKLAPLYFRFNVPQASLIRDELPDLPGRHNKPRRTAYRKNILSKSPLVRGGATDTISVDMQIQTQNQIAEWVDGAITGTSVLDLHTHLYPAMFGPLCLWGIDELLTYHYLIAETLRAGETSYEKFWSLAKGQQADLIWKTLFLDRAPISESCRGILTVLHELGLDVASKNLNSFRDFFRQQKSDAYIDHVFKIANVRSVVMTNDLFDPTEYSVWEHKPAIDPRFSGVLRIDPLLLGWPGVQQTLGGMGYNVSADMGAKSMSEARRFLTDGIGRVKALYVACSLTPDWKYPDDSACTKILNEAILPIAREHNLPFAMMIGVTRRVNPQLKLAGDAVGKADIVSINRILADNPKNKFMMTLLSRENQHELAVTARKFPNLMLFGCWWFLNNPSLIEEITRMRMELLGTTFTPQHSDARVLDQLIYKWTHSRQIIGKVLKDKFADLAATGWNVTKEEIDRTAKEYLGGNFERFLAWTPA